MYLRYVFFLLFSFVLSSQLAGQSQDPDLMTLINNPFAETLRPVLEFQSAQWVVKLVNGFRETVVLTQVRLSQDGSTSSALLKTPVEFAPAEVRYINLVSPAIDLRRDIRLTLEMVPKPPKQKSEFLFRFEPGTNRIVEAESNSRPG